MKNILFLFLFLSSFAFSQMPNIEKVWLNNSNPYIGTIGNQKQELKMKINISEQDRKNDQEYFVAGYTLVDRTYSKFEGKIIITKYKNGRKRNVVFGEYDFAEEPTGKHSGTLKGKFIYTFNWNRKTEQIDSQFIEFIGAWTSYDGTLNYRTNIKNQ
ncbi:hypothetical protein MTP09_04990 [Chryseobacterium suipulveris]|uniref:Uncharacterized protein n=1 Tax=Chryseobacterium suipulveris TaxID=2929800 RepID=A0ABY4BS20_9FLAO|nr:hypothetical protein [Chryseobacterium suipulveris]UOE41991.1 hypothetical protein MTP09_04990 [Chryseobacterium suipulveris]